MLLFAPTDTWEEIDLFWFHRLVTIAKDYYQLLLRLLGGSDRSFVDDLVVSGYCKHESNLCVARCWGLSRVSMICSSLLFEFENGFGCSVITVACGCRAWCSVFQRRSFVRNGRLWSETWFVPPYFSNVPFRCSAFGYSSCGTLRGQASAIQRSLDDISCKIVDFSLGCLTVAWRPFSGEIVDASCSAFGSLPAELTRWAKSPSASETLFFGILLPESFRRDIWQRFDQIQPHRRVSKRNFLDGSKTHFDQIQPHERFFWVLRFKGGWAKTQDF